MKGVPAIIAALPREVALLVGKIPADKQLKVSGIYLYRLPGATVVCAGMGSVRAMLAVNAAVSNGNVSMLISTGLAGGCNPAITVGSVVEAGLVVDASTGARYRAGTGGDSVLVTTHAVAGIREKERLSATYRASIVDMEGATVARMAEIKGLPFRVIKAISDGHNFELSSLSRFASPHGHFRTGAFALHTALRPRSWRHAMRLGAGSQRALRALTVSLQEVLEIKE